MNLRFLIILLVFPLIAFSQSDTLYFPEDSLKALGSYKDNLKNGTWSWFYWDNNLQSKGEYCNDNPCGIWENWLPNGKRKNIVTYDSLGIKHGMYIEYDYRINETHNINYSHNSIEGQAVWISFEGDTLLTGNFKNNKMDGLYLRYWNNGTIRAKYHMKNSKQNGISYRYNEDGNLFEKGEYWNDKYIGTWTFWDSLSRITKTLTYDSIGQKHGEFIWYNYSDTTTITENYKFDELNGVCYTIDSKKDTIGIKYYSHNKKDGDWKWFDSTNNLTIYASFENDLLNGQWISYFENGKIHEKGKFYLGNKTGEWIIYDDPYNRNFSKGFYENDNKIGVWSFYDSNSQLIKRIKN